MPPRRTSDLLCQKGGRPRADGDDNKYQCHLCPNMAPYAGASGLWYHQQKYHGASSRPYRKGKGKKAAGKKKADKADKAAKRRVAKVAPRVSSLAYPSAAHATGKKLSPRGRPASPPGSLREEEEDAFMRVLNESGQDLFEALVPAAKLRYRAWVSAQPSSSSQPHQLHQPQPHQPQPPQPQPQPPQQSKYLSFDVARSFARTLELESVSAWSEYTKSGMFPSNIPNAPWMVYRAAGWVSYPDWLGYGGQKRATEDGSAAAAAAAATAAAAAAAAAAAKDVERQTLVHSGGAHAAVSPAAPRAPRIERDPDQPYFPKEGDPFIFMPWMAFPAASAYAKTLDLKSEAEWRKHAADGKLPSNVPDTPETTYRFSPLGKASGDTGWVSYYDWLGIPPPPKEEEEDDDEEDDDDDDDEDERRGKSKTNRDSSSSSSSSRVSSSSSSSSRVSSSGVGIRCSKCRFPKKGRSSKCTNPSCAEDYARSISDGIILSSSNTGVRKNFQARHVEALKKYALLNKFWDGTSWCLDYGAVAELMSKATGATEAPFDAASCRRRMDRLMQSGWTLATAKETKAAEAKTMAAAAEGEGGAGERDAKGKRKRREEAAVVAEVGGEKKEERMEDKRARQGGDGGSTGGDDSNGSESSNGGEGGEGGAGGEGGHAVNSQAVNDPAVEEAQPEWQGHF